MSKKKRGFDIDFDMEGDAPNVPAGTEARRGPMAAAITENAEALSSRQQAEEAIRAENDALAHEHVRLKKAGLITDLIPLDLIDITKLVRDRAEGRDDELDELKQSIREVGLSNPIRVEQVGERYELIQGFRRLSAFRELYEEHGEDFARIPAGINARGEDQLRLYRRMVDENMVRRGVSFGEMAQLAINYRKAAPETESYDQAVELLYASAGRQKRSYIKSFARLLALLDGHLEHVEAVPRATGLSVVRHLDEGSANTRALRAALAAVPDRDAEEEQAIMGAFLKDVEEAEKAPKPKKDLAPGKTTFRLDRPEGEARCTVAAGRIEVRLNHDFSGVERQRLQDAITALLDAIS